jgi:hypothetical protein
MEEYSGNLIIFGGKTYNSIVNDVWRYNLFNHHFVQLYPSPPSSISSSFSVLFFFLLNNSIFVLIGKVYDPTSSKSSFSIIMWIGDIQRISFHFWRIYG